MNCANIDSLNDVDITTLSFSSLRVKYGTHRSMSTGTGRNKKHSSRIGCQTEIGDIRADIWRELAEQMVMRAGENELLEHLIVYVDSLPWMKNEPRSVRRTEALELHMRRIFDNPEWVQFIPFNESWRPEALDSIEIVEIITPCCQKPGRVPIQQTRRETGDICCPHCGRNTTFHIL